MTNLREFYNYKNLIFLPHYDDEVFLLPYLHKLNSLNVETHLLWLTQSGGINKKYNDKLIYKRKKESENFILKTGLKNIQIHHLGLLFSILDGKLYLKIEEIEDYIFKKFNGKEWSLVTPHWENGHSDHDAAFLLGKKLELNGFGRHFSFSLYNTNSSFKPFQVMKLESIDSKLRIKIEITNRLTFILAPFYFKSQLKAWFGLYLPIIYKTLFRKYIYLFEGKKISIIQFKNMRLIKRRAKNDVGFFLEWVHEYCVKNKIPII
jgi:hypothetical protein